METKNVIINNFCNALMGTIQNLSMIASQLGDKYEENLSTIKTINVYLESCRSQIVNIQNALDTYPE